MSGSNAGAASILPSPPHSDSVDVNGGAENEEEQEHARAQSLPSASNWPSPRGAADSRVPVSAPTVSPPPALSASTPPLSLSRSFEVVMATSTSAAPFTASPMPAPRMATFSTATSIGDDAAENALVHNFDLSKYKDGQYRLIPASARDQIRYTGRFLHHGPFAKRKSKVNTVQFDWSAVAFEIVVCGTNTVAIRLKGDGSLFYIFSFVVTLSSCYLCWTHREVQRRQSRKTSGQHACDHSPDLSWTSIFFVSLLS